MKNSSSSLTCRPDFLRMLNDPSLNLMPARHLCLKVEDKHVDLTGVNAALVTVPVFKTGETSYSDVWWVRFPSAPAFTAVPET